MGEHELVGEQGLVGELGLVGEQGLVGQRLEPRWAGGRAVGATGPRRRKRSRKSRTRRSGRRTTALPGRGGWVTARWVDQHAVCSPCPLPRPCNTVVTSGMCLYTCCAC